jgi:hypothetical protein
VFRLGVDDEVVDLLVLDVLQDGPVVGGLTLKEMNLDFTVVRCPHQLSKLHET